MAKRDHFHSQIVSRRRVLIILGLGGSAALATACQPAPSPAPPAPPAAPAAAATSAPAAATPAAPAAAPGGAAAAKPSAAPAVQVPAAKPAQGAGFTLTWAFGVDPVSLDPADVSFIQPQQFYMFDYLTSLTPALTVAPGLATDWSASPDGLKWTFRLRRGAQFHDGTPIDASAVKFTFDRVLDQKKARKARQYLTPGFVKSAQVVDDATVEITLDQPFGGLPSLLSTTPGIVSPKAAQELGDDFGRHPVGSGPFKFQEWVSGQRITLLRNDNYWGPKAKAQRLVIMPVPDDTTRVAMLERGDVDIAQHVPPSQRKRLSGNPDIKLVPSEALETRQVRFIMLKEVYKDVRVRQAMNYAINAPEIVDTVLDGLGSFTGGPLPKALPGALQSSKFHYDPAMARKLLADAGYGNGKVLKASLIASKGVTAGADEVLTALQAQWKAVGIDVALNILDQSAVDKNRYLGPEQAEEKHMPSVGISAAFPDAHAALYARFHSSQWSPQGQNYSFYKNDRVDLLLDQGAKESDPAKRAPMYHEIEQILLEDVPSVFLYNSGNLYGARSNVKDIVLYPTEILNLPEISKA